MRVTTRRMALVTRVACDKEGDGNGYKSDGNKGDRQAMATRAMVTAMATAKAKATMWVMAMVTRIAGGKEGKGEGGKGNGDDDEGGTWATERARVARQWQQQHGWRARGR
jgi:hypothetical protein